MPVKRERDDSVAAPAGEVTPGELDTAIPRLASAAAAVATAADDAAVAAFKSAELEVREQLVAAIKAAPVKSVVDVSALQAFKRQHLAMMQKAP